MAESKDWEVQPTTQQNAFLGWDTRDFVRFFLSNLAIILVALAAGVFIGYSVYQNTPRSYEATGSFLVDELPFRQTVQSGDAETERQLAQTLILSLASRPMLSSVAKRLNIEENRIQFLDLGLPLKLDNPLPEANIRIVPTRNTRLGTITATSQNSEFAAQVVNAILDEMQIFNRAGGRLKNLQVNLEFHRTSSENLLRQLADLSAKRLKAEKEKSALDEYARQKLPLEAFPAFSDDTTLNNLKTQLVLVQSEYDAIASTSVRGARLDGKKAELNGLKGQVTQLAQRLADALRSQFEILVKQETNLKTEGLALQDQMDKITQEAAQISQSTGDPAALSKLLGSPESGPSGVANVITIIDRSTPPPKPVKPKLWVNLALGILFGGAIGLGTATFRAILDIRLRSAQQIERQTGKPCLAMIAKMPHPTVHRPVLSVFERSKYSVGFSYLRTFLLRTEDEVKQRRIVAFTHTRPEKDCSRLTAFMGLLLAQAEKRTLVVDLHFRTPRIATYFGITVEKDLSAWFATDDPLNDYVNYSVVRELAVLSVKDPNRPDLNDLLSRRQFANALVSLLDHWDHILIDAPNILLDWKLMLALPEKGRVIICARYGRSTSEDAIQAIARAQGPGWEVAGLVMTFCPERLTH